jgi:predicted HNH restriction endonuclease
MIALSSQDRAIRRILVDVAARRARTRRSGLISYKELWEATSPHKWYQARTPEIVDRITRVSAFELQSGRPPLNELVVQTQRLIPRQPWKGVAQYLHKLSGVRPAYENHRAAQQACWDHWLDREPTDEVSAEEGYQQDRTAKFRSRNQSLVAARKAKDNHTCQACEFRLAIGDRFVIDCHHTKPLHKGDVRVTSLADLECLCPTCHRIAHSTKIPLPVVQIKKILKRSSLS